MITTYEPWFHFHGYDHLEAETPLEKMVFSKRQFKKG
jgi:hypothetical protein